MALGRAALLRANLRATLAAAASQRARQASRLGPASAALHHVHIDVQSNTPRPSVQAHTLGGVRKYAQVADPTPVADEVHEQPSTPEGTATLEQSAATGSPDDEFRRELVHALEELLSDKHLSEFTSLQRLQAKTPYSWMNIEQLATFPQLRNATVDDIREAARSSPNFKVDAGGRAIRRLNPIVEISVANAHMINWEAYLLTITSEQKLREAFEVLKECHEKLDWIRSRLFVLVIETSGELGRIEIADDVILYFNSAGLQMTRPMYERYAMACADAREFERMFATLDTFRAKGNHMSAVIFSRLLDSVSKTHNLDHALGLMKRMADHGVRPDAFTCGLVLRTCGLEDYERMELLFKDMEATGNVDTMGCRYMIRAMVKKGVDPDEIKSTMDRLKEKGVRPPIEAYEGYLKAVALTGNFQQAMAAVGELEEMGYQRTDAMWRSLFRCLRNKVKGYRQARALAEEYVMSGRQLGQYQYNVLMHCAKNEARSTEVVRLYQEMLAHNVVPDSAALIVTMSAHAKLGEVEQVEALMAKAQELGYEVNHMMCNAFIQANGMRGGPDVAAEAGRKLPEMYANFQQTPETVNIMLSVMANKVGVSAALAMLMDYNKNGFSPDVITFTILISAAGRENKPELMFAMLDRMKEMGIEPNEYTMSVLLSRCSELGYVKGVSTVYKMIEEKGWTDSVSIVGNLTLPAPIPQILEGTSDSLGDTDNETPTDEADETEQK